VLSLVAVVVGSAMPWASVNIFGTTISSTGLNAGDGWFSLLLGLAGIGCGLALIGSIRIGAKPIVLVVGELVAGAVAAVIALLDFTEAASYGIILVLLGGASAFVAGLLEVRDLRAAKATPTPPPVTAEASAGSTQGE
jgi:hypothetical protein